MLSTEQCQEVLVAYGEHGYAEAGRVAVRLIRDTAPDAISALESIALMAEASELWDIANVARTAMQTKK